MLESDYTTQIEELLTKLPCGIQLPVEWGDYFALEERLLPTTENENRRWARKHFRTKAVLQIKTTLPAIIRQSGEQVVYTRDISRGSISFLHAEQLYPGELCRLWLTDRRLRVIVERCNRAGPYCYVVGGTFE